MGELPSGVVQQQPWNPVRRKVETRNDPASRTGIPGHSDLGGADVDQVDLLGLEASHSSLQGLLVQGQVLGTAWEADFRHRNLRCVGHIKIGWGPWSNVIDVWLSTDALQGSQRKSCCVHEAHVAAEVGQPRLTGPDQDRCRRSRASNLRGLADADKETTDLQIDTEGRRLL